MGTVHSICDRLGVTPLEPGPGCKFGLAIATIGQMPVNGARYLPTDTTSGWYIYCGDECFDADDFFSPLHHEHLPEYLPLAIPYLALPPGYRFQIDDKGYEDIWYDEAILIQ